MSVSAHSIAQIVSGEILGNPDVTVHSPSKIEEGGEGTVSFLAHEKYEHCIYKSTASVVLVSKEFTPTSEVSPTLIKVENVYEALGKLLAHFEQKPYSHQDENSTAQIHKNARMGSEVSVGHFSIISDGVDIGDDSLIGPQVFIGQGVRIGKNNIIHSGVKIHHGCIIGDHCTIHSNSVIGSDGFGFAKDSNGQFSKIPQVGNVVIENNVHIGSNVSIDRATMGSTIINSGVKLDNLIHIAHNVVIGENTAIAAQTGIAGSAKLGSNMMVGGQVGIIGHITIADETQIQAQSGVGGSIKEKGAKLYGSPAIEYGNYLKSYAIFKKLPEMAKKLRDIERHICDIKKE